MPKEVVMTKTMRNLFSGASVAALLAVGTSAAMATPIPLGGYSGPIQIKFTDYEAFTAGSLSTSNSNYGILAVTSVLDGSGNTIYSGPATASSSNPIIMGVFSGIHVGSSGGASAEANTPGAFSFYDVTTAGATFGAIASQGGTTATNGYSAAGCAVNTQCYNLITNQGYDNILNFSLVQGASSADTSSYLHATITSSSPLTGEASGFADITGGSDAGQFNKGTKTTALGTLADLSIQDNFCANGSTFCSSFAANWPLISNDPVRTSVVPEPGTLTLVGAGLLALGTFAGWRRKRAAAGAA
jgi:hypothetical protein